MFRKFNAEIEKQSENKVKIMRTNHGGEFASAAFNEYCEEMGILRQLTTRYTP